MDDSQVNARGVDRIKVGANFLFEGLLAGWGPGSLGELASRLDDRQAVLVFQEHASGDIHGRAFPIARLAT